MGIVGQIVLWPTQKTPKGWAACKGAEFGPTTLPQLWEVILQTYGAAGRSFGFLPDFSQRRAIGAGQGPGLPDHPLGSARDDSSAGTGGVEFLSMPSIILTEGTFPWEASAGLLGTILPFAGERVPQFYLPCDGRLLQISQYGDLFSILGSRFGGDGRTTFALPDLRGRAPQGVADGKQAGETGDDQSVAGSYGYLTINYVIAAEPPPIGGLGNDTPMIGQIVYTGADFAPRGWAFCRGQILAIAEYQSLFALLGNEFGGDGQNTFALPDLRGRLVIDSDLGLGAVGALTTGGDGCVDYLSVEPLIATEGLFPPFD